MDALVNRASLCYYKITCKYMYYRDPILSGCE